MTDILPVKIPLPVPRPESADGWRVKELVEHLPDIYSYDHLGKFRDMDFNIYEGADWAYFLTGVAIVSGILALIGGAVYWLIVRLIKWVVKGEK